MKKDGPVLKKSIQLSSQRLTNYSAPVIQEPGSVCSIPF